MSTLLDVDTAAIARLGRQVSARLMSDPSVQKVAVEQVDMFAAAEFLSPAECDRLIGMIDGVAKPSRVYDPENQTQYRTSYSGDIDRADSFVRMVDRRICDLLGIEPSWGESVQGQRYTPGQEFHGHHDWFHVGSDYWAEEQARGGQRSWTAMVYLNDVEDGGTTEFPRIGVSIPPQRGLLLTWNNGLPNGLPNQDTLHAALPVTQGSKYIITKWFRTREWG
jgi:prolyl 4-hydroxylase